jgi:hypothetical protein
MAYKDAMSAMDDFSLQGATMMAAQATTDAATTAGIVDITKWQSEQNTAMLEKMYDSLDSQVQSMTDAMVTGDFDVSDIKGTQYRLYREAWDRRQNIFKQWASSLGKETYDTDTDIIALVDAMFEETKRTVDNPRKYLKWGDKKGKWAEVIETLSPGSNLDLVEIVWNDRYNKLKGDKGERRRADSISAQESVDFKRDETIGERLGFGEIIVDPVEGAPWWLEPAATWWKSEVERKRLRREATSEQGQRLIDRVLETKGERKTRLDSPDLSQYEDAAIRRNKAQTLLAGIATAPSVMPEVGRPTSRVDEAAVIARRGVEDIEPLMGPGEGLINGFLAQGTQEDDVPDLTKQAMNFLIRLAEMIQEVGPEEAYRLMSAEFKELGRSDKRNIEEYLLKQRQQVV